MTSLRLHSVFTIAALCMLAPQTRGNFFQDPWVLSKDVAKVPDPKPHDPISITQTSEEPLGDFDEQSDIGVPNPPGSSSYDPASRTYAVRSAGGSIGSHHDEFRFISRQVSGDILVAATVSFPEVGADPRRAAVLMIRQSLDDGSVDAAAELLGSGEIRLVCRRSDRGPVEGVFTTTVPMRTNHAPTVRIGIERKGGWIHLLLGTNGEPLRPIGPALRLPLSASFEVGLGFCSHRAGVLDQANFSDVILQPAVARTH